MECRWWCAAASPIYDDRGELQIAAEYIEPKGAGGLQVAFEQLKAKLEAEGLFAAERKKAIPTLPARIGIVTSPQAAALRDILNILQRRHHTANAVIYPAQVQGEMAAAEVAAGVRYFNQNRGVEVIIVTRGGGSAEDLAAFNDEKLARAVAASEIPVISAVGHETDFTIIDFVADLRAPTPSAAAELVIRSRVDIENQAEAVRRAAGASHGAPSAGSSPCSDRAGAARRICRHDGFDPAAPTKTGRPYLSAWNAASAKCSEQLRRRWENVSATVRHYDLRRVLAGIRAELDAGTSAMASAMRNQLLQNKVRLERMGRALETLSPLAVLQRGYALIFDAAGNLVKDAAQLNPGDDVRARLARGEIQAAVTASDANRSNLEKQ